jgi:succinate dehydrogenase / fumarate reductase cytochrome b subunit
MSGSNKFLNSSIGNKFLVAITGLFLILFLVIHLLGNLLLLINDGEGEMFNSYSEIMGTNIFIKVVAWVLYISIIAHTVKGVSIWIKNRRARGTQKYAVKSGSNSTFASRNMMLLGTLVFFFIAIHMGQFWYQFKFTHLAEESSHFEIVQATFQIPWVVIVYVLGCVALAWHLSHGFQSAFQTLGLRRGRYVQLIQRIGLAFAIVVSVLFALIPILMYLGIYPIPEFTVLPGQ